MAKTKGRRKNKSLKTLPFLHILKCDAMYAARKVEPEKAVEACPLGNPWNVSLVIASVFLQISGV